MKVLGPPRYEKHQASPYCYDGTWTIAYALDKTLKGSNYKFSQRSMT